MIKLGILIKIYSSFLLFTAGPSFHNLSNAVFRSVVKCRLPDSKMLKLLGKQKADTEFPNSSGQLNPGLPITERPGDVAPCHL